MSDHLSDADRVLLDEAAAAAAARQVETTAILVAGMHRSGTSALVRVLNLLGVDLPKELYPTRPDNPLGYWEPLHVVEAHEKFLTAIGSSFEDVFTLPPGSLRGEAARELEDRLVAIIESEFAGSRQFVVKDPRLCRVVPIWIAALARFGAAPRFVLPIRHPLEVAASLKIRNEYSTTRALLLWLRHMLEAELHTRGFPRSVVSYEQLLRDWQGTVDKIGRELGVAWPRRSHAASAEIEQFLSPRGRHHSFDLDELRARADIVDWVKTTYEVFAAAADGERLEEDVLDALRGELDRADSAFGPLLAELDLAQRTQQEALAEQTAKLAEAKAAAEAARQQVEQLQAELAQQEQTLAEARTDLARLTTELAQREGAFPAASADAATARHQIDQPEAEHTQQEQAVAAAGTEAAAARRQVGQLQAELTRQELALSLARAEVPRLRSELAQREEALAASSAEAATAREQVRQLQSDLTGQEHAVANGRTELLRLATELGQQQEQLAEAATRAQALEQQVQTLGEESAAHAADAQRALAEFEGLRAESKTRTEQLEAALAAIEDGRRQKELFTLELGRQMEAVSAAEVEAQQLRAESEALHTAQATHESEISQLIAEKSGLGAALAEIKKEADRIREDARRNAELTDDLRGQLAAEQAAVAGANEELRAARVKLAEAEAASADRRAQLAKTETALADRDAQLAKAEAAFADRDAKLAKLQSRRFVRPRTRLRTASQFLSWLIHPRRWHLVGEYRRVRRAATFDAGAYLAENPDVDASGLDPLMHYLEHGIREGRALAPPAAVAYELSTGVTQLPPPAAPVAAAIPRTVQAATSGPVAAADYSDFVVLLSRQRSGTNPLRAVLGTHPDVFCFNEVFNLPDRDSDEPLLRESNFFTFLERYAKDDIRRMTPDNHERLFLDYLEYLRCLSQRQYAVIDVKYNTTHFLARPWQERGAPFLLELVVKHGMYVLNVTRRNYLRFVLSTLKAWRSDLYTVSEGDAPYADWTTELDPEYVLGELAFCREEDERIQRELTVPDRVLTLDYAEIFPGDVAVSPEFLERFAAWRGIPNEFTLETEYRKQSTLPLRETIENYEQIAETLRDGPFAYCLEDEPSYRPAKPSAPRGTLERVSYSASQRERWLETIGLDPDAFVENLCRTRPGWISGSLSEDDARFLFHQALTAAVDVAVEIGTASGFSTAILGHAFHFRGAAEWRVRSYDILERLYYDEERRVGDAARELLAEALLAHVEFNSPKTAADVGGEHPADSIGFLFVDANHRHPWPALDLLEVLPALRPGGLVLLHDINLPRIHPEFPDWGASHVFEALDVEKLVPDVEVPNIGAFVVPDDKAALRAQLLAVIDAHRWEVEVPEDVLEHAKR